MAMFVQVQVQVVATRASLHFFEPQKLPVKCWTDSDEWVGCVVSECVAHRLCVLICLCVCLGAEFLVGGGRSCCSYRGTEVTLFVHVFVCIMYAH